MKYTITIEYCPKCHWLMRAAYMAQELLTTFDLELSAITLKPSEVGGRYVITVNDHVIFDRKQHGGFIEIKEIKQLVRDLVAPEKILAIPTVTDGRFNNYLQFVVSFLVTDCITTMNRLLRRSVQGSVILFTTLQWSF